MDLVSEVWQKKEKNIEKEEVKFSFFTNGMNLYVENLNLFVKTYIKVYLIFPS